MEYRLSDTVDAYKGLHVSGAVYRRLEEVVTVCDLDGDGPDDLAWAEEYVGVVHRLRCALAEWTEAEQAAALAAAGVTEDEALNYSHGLNRYGDEDWEAAGDGAQLVLMAAGRAR